MSSPLPLRAWAATRTKGGGRRRIVLGCSAVLIRTGGLPTAVSFLCADCLDGWRCREERSHRRRCPIGCSVGEARAGLMRPVRVRGRRFAWRRRRISCKLDWLSFSQSGSPMDVLPAAAAFAAKFFLPHRDGAFAGGGGRGPHGGVNTGRWASDGFCRRAGLERLRGPRWHPLQRGTAAVGGGWRQLGRPAGGAWCNREVCGDTPCNVGRWR
jgi:hypothetical protein